MSSKYSLRRLLSENTPSIDPTLRAGGAQNRVGGVSTPTGELSGGRLAGHYKGKVDQNLIADYVLQDGNDNTVVIGMASSGTAPDVLVAIVEETTTTTKGVGGRKTYKVIKDLYEIEVKGKSGSGGDYVAEKGAQTTVRDIKTTTKGKISTRGKNKVGTKTTGVMQFAASGGSSAGHLGQLGTEEGLAASATQGSQIEAGEYNNLGLTERFLGLVLADEIRDMNGEPFTLKMSGGNYRLVAAGETGPQYVSPLVKAKSGSREVGYYQGSTSPDRFVQIDNKNPNFSNAVALPDVKTVHYAGVHGTTAIIYRIQDQDPIFPDSKTTNLFAPGVDVQFIPGTGFTVTLNKEHFTSAVAPADGGPGGVGITRNDFERDARETARGTGSTGSQVRMLAKYTKELNSLDSVQAGSESLAEAWSNSLEASWKPDGNFGKLCSHLNMKFKDLEELKSAEGKVKMGKVIRYLASCTYTGDCTDILDNFYTFANQRIIQQSTDMSGGKTPRQQGPGHTQLQRAQKLLGNSYNMGVCTLFANAVIDFCFGVGYLSDNAFNQYPVALAGSISQLERAIELWSPSNVYEGTKFRFKDMKEPVALQNPSDFLDIDPEEDLVDLVNDMAQGIYPDGSADFGSETLDYEGDVHSDLYDFIANGEASSELERWARSNPDIMGQLEDRYGIRMESIRRRLGRKGQVLKERWKKLAGIPLLG
ncbi:MAG: hypothetical protein CBD74_02325 [Saprospirales bacterium TMED214]|nr:MAG: hypothetical protein CBD74_02325 [Saprospirales bacterium TMED214]